MTKEDVFNYFYTNSTNLSVQNILFILLGGLVISLIIYFTYFATYRGVAYNARFNASLIVILLISIVIMLMISSNIIISLGMVGALSIVRFRTAIKDARDTVFIFWAIAEGLSVGSQNFKLALVTTVFIAIIMFVVSFIPSYREKYLVIVRGGEEDINIEEVSNVLKKFSRGIKMRAANQDKQHSELIFEIRARGGLNQECSKELSNLEGVEAINWVVESGENVG